MGDFKIELERLINRHSMENGSNTPDFMLANYLQGCLDLFDSTVASREKWYGRVQVGKYHVKVDFDLANEKKTTGEALIDTNKEKNMSDTRKEFDELRENNKDIIGEHIAMNNKYHQAYNAAKEAKAELDKNLENPVVQRYEELLDIMEAE